MSQEEKKTETAKREEEILAFWNENKIFEKSLQKSSPKGEFVFYDGPPFATGLPHSGSLLSSVIKDVMPRYKTMRGYHVRRRWGWDTHGLPIESIIEKKLGLKTKKDILDIGVERFNEAARATVLEYVSEWQRYVERVGRWVDFENSYKTMDNSYIESVWWGLKKIHDDGRLYEGKKVLMYCPHCETPLAKAEIAMDNTYKDITEEAVTVSFRVTNPEAYDLPQNTFILAWTTTPWTLPGNVALAVGDDIEYGVYEMDGNFYLAAKERAAMLGLEHDVDDTEKTNNTYALSRKGKEFVGITYEPLFTIEKVAAYDGPAHEVVSADFVSTEEGTGIVHTAVMYGEDDFILGKEKGLPMVQLLNPNGTYNDDTPGFIRGKFIKDAERDIKKDLEERDLLFEKKNHTHSYPHCYRCDAALIYNALSSWFIDIQSVKEKLLSENEKINWQPEHLKHGRFKNIVENAPDWTISRNRFWASPLPIWKDKEGNVTVIGSLDELKEKTKKSGNAYFVLRHGESEKNVEPRIVTDNPDAPYHLTEKGRQQVHDAISALNEGVDLIVSSPVLRCKETALLAADLLNITKLDVVFDNNIRELEHGLFEGRPLAEYESEYPVDISRFERAPKGGETWSELRKRMGAFLYGLEEQYKNKRILIISHGDPLGFLSSIAQGLSKEQTIQSWDERYPEKGKIQQLDFVPLPHNADYELDFHLPYIDQIELQNEGGEPLYRVPEVVDCWVESGSMPFAEYHYPFENKSEFEKRSQGDFIAEYIAQTRTWFYYMHALGALLFNQCAFKNVVSTGTVLAADGQKISKSKQNYTDPYILFETYGADAFRFYFMSSVVMQSEDMLFKDDELRDVHNKVVNLFRNTLSFYELYKDTAPAPSRASSHTLDRWIVARLDEVQRTVTKAFENYDTIRASRPMRDFIDDFSTWYVRRSRDRVKEGGDDAALALSTMRYVLLEFSKLTAPITPFIADEVFRSARVDADPESVHLAAWPEEKKGFFGFGVKKDEELLLDMKKTREVISEALKMRQVAGFKVRQPLASVMLKDAALEGKDEFLELIKEEVNVKQVNFNASQEEEVVLDTEITPELKEEGDVRELMRVIQDLRKKAGLSPRDKAVLYYADDTTLLEKHWEIIQRPTGLVRFEKAEDSYVKSA